MKNIIILFFVIIVPNTVIAQVYSPVLNYYKNGNTEYGIKIKTNIPFQHQLGMPTLIIEGYNYGKAQPIGLMITWYVYKEKFYNYKASSFGAYTPDIKLCVENQKIVVFINDKTYFSRFTIRAYSISIRTTSDMFQNWLVVDEEITDENVVTIPYMNSFSGNIFFPGGKWKDDGKVGIGTTTPDYKLDVNGTIRSKEIKVETGWSDFVFEEDYNLKSLEELETYISQNKHLPDIPTEAQVKEKGVNLGEMNAKLLQKVEELTLYIIEQNKGLKIQRKENQKQKCQIEILKEKILKLEKYYSKKLIP